MDLNQIRVLDQHAHNLLTPEAAAQLPYAAAFTETNDPGLVERDARSTLCYRRSLRDIAELLACEASEDSILQRRTALGLESLTEHCFRSANLEAVLLDDGFRAEEILPIAWHERFVPVRRLLRLEVLAQDLLPRTEQFATFVERFRAALDPPPPGVAAFKSIAAYRSGLAIQPVTWEEAEHRFTALRQQTGGGPVRLADKPLVDFLLTQALEIAARHRLPVQLHTGFGDPDLDLRLANPLHLRPILEDRRYRAAPLVLLHASYPYAREAGYLAAVYPQVYLDFGLAVPFLSVGGMRCTVRMLLELAPTSKVMYASDAHLIPELFYLGAKWGRAILGQVLDEALEDGDLTAVEAENVAAAILADNARALYRLELASRGA